MRRSFGWCTSCALGLVQSRYWNLSPVKPIARPNSIPDRTSWTKSVSGCTPCVEAQGRAIDRQTLTPFFVYGGVDDPLRVVASGQAEGGHANFGRYGPGRARADPGVVMLGERYDGRGMLCCELKRARGRVVGEENDPLRAVCQHLLES